MNFDQAKALRLQQGRSTLDDHDFRMQNPEAHRQTLHTMSATLATEGLIDELQQFDTNEMANAAYWHAVEELQTTPGRYCGASTYDVLLHGSTELFGKIGRSIFYTASTLADACAILLRREDLPRCSWGEPCVHPVRDCGENHRAYLDPAGWAAVRPNRNGKNSRGHHPRADRGPGPLPCAGGRRPGCPRVPISARFRKSTSGH